MIETYINLDGIECVYYVDENGLQHSMLKSAWDELEAAKENGTIS